MNLKFASALSAGIILLVFLFSNFSIKKTNSDLFKNETEKYSENDFYQPGRKMKIESSIFINNGTIPVEYTCNGASRPIPLKVSGVPGNAKSLALIVDDPDAPSGDFVHWVIWNIDPKIKIIESKKLMGAVEGFTSLKKPGWVAPCPPSGIHHYHFKLYALDTILHIPQSSTKKELISAMNGKIIDSTILTGLYGR